MCHVSYSLRIVRIYSAAVNYQHTSRWLMQDARCPFLAVLKALVIPAVIDSSESLVSLILTIPARGLFLTLFEADGVP